nr:hypothetical protein [Photorhabdus akhurstii]
MDDVPSTDKQQPGGECGPGCGARPKELAFCGLALRGATGGHDNEPAGNCQSQRT